MITFLEYRFPDCYRYPKISLEGRVSDPLKYKDDCLALIEEFLGINELVRKRGVMELENIVAGSPYFLLRDGAELISGGTEPYTVYYVLENYLQYSSLPEKELLMHCIMAQGLLLMQNGEYPYVMKKILISMLGTETSKDYFADCTLSDWMANDAMQNNERK